MCSVSGKGKLFPSTASCPALGHAQSPINMGIGNLTCVKKRSGSEVAYSI
jgi:hypothetical protein